MKLQQLRYLAATAELGTMTAAANALHVTQPALTRAIHALESETGVLLFRREGRNVVLTEAGHDFMELVRPVLAGVDALEDFARRRRLPPELVLATTPTISVGLGTELIAALRTRLVEIGAADVRLRLLRCGGPDEVAAAVRAGTAELGLSDFPTGAVAHPATAVDTTAVDTAAVDTTAVDTAADDLHRDDIGTWEIVLLSPPDADLPDPFPLDRLGTVPLVVTAPGTSRRVQIESVFAELDQELQVGVETDERSTFLPSVMAGLGSCITYATMTEEAHAAGATVRSFDPPVTRTIGLLRRSEQMSEPARILVELARARTAPHD